MSSSTYHVSSSHCVKSGFRHISHLPQTRGLEKKIAEGPPCVVLASPGMLQSGMSRELLELWAPDGRNGLIVTGYSVEGTMARVSTSLFFLFTPGISVYPTRTIHFFFKFPNLVFLSGSSTTRRHNL